MLGSEGGSLADGGDRLARVCCASAARLRVRSEHVTAKDDLPDVVPAPGRLTLTSRKSGASIAPIVRPTMPTSTYKGQRARRPLREVLASILP
jgi:hypothetical protein